MGFLAPWFFSLSILVGGFLLLYFFRKQYKEKTISQTFLWRQVRKEWEATKWYQKLQHNLLFWLQLLALLFLILSLADPYLLTKGASGLQTVVIMDTSASMAAYEDSSDGEMQTRFNVAKEQINEILRQQYGSDVTVIEAKNEPEVVIQSNTQEAVNAINEMTLSFEQANMSQSLSLATALMNSEEPAVIHVFSDRVKKEDLPTDWSGPIYVHNIGENEWNVSLSSFGVSLNEDRVQGVAKVTTTNDEKQSITFQIKVTDETVYESTVEVAEASPAFISIDQLPIAEVYQAIILTEDPFVYDNQKTAYLYTAQTPQVIVNPDIHPYVYQALDVMGYEPIMKETLEQGDEESIHVVEGLSPEQWPHTPLLVINPNMNRDEHPVLKIQSPIEKKEHATLLKYVDLAEVYIEEAQKLSLNGLTSLAASGDVPLFYSGIWNGKPVIVINFDISKTDWPLHSSFPIFLFEALKDLQDDNLFIGTFRPNEEKIISLEGEYHILNEQEEIVGNFNPEETVFNAPSQPGFYTLYNGENQYYVSVEVDENETDITAEKSFVLGEEHLEEREMSFLWTFNHWLILFVFILLVIEWEVYRRGTRA